MAQPAVTSAMRQVITTKGDEGRCLETMLPASAALPLNSPAEPPSKPQAGLEGHVDQGYVAAGILVDVGALLGFEPVF